MTDALTFDVIHTDDLADTWRAAIINLCAAAYDENFDRLFALLPGSTHVLARLDGELVSHAAWVTRWLQPHGYPALRTAYVEAVATAPAYHGRGFGTAVMQRLQQHIDAYDLGALSPSDPAFYARLGWELWRGPLAIRMEDQVLPTPDDQVMILRLPRTPPLDVHALLTAESRDGEVW